MKRIKLRQALFRSAWHTKKWLRKPVRSGKSLLTTAALWSSIRLTPGPGLPSSTQRNRNRTSLVVRKQNADRHEQNEQMLEKSSSVNQKSSSRRKELMRLGEEKANFRMFMALQAHQAYQLRQAQVEQEKALSEAEGSQVETKETNESLVNHQASTAAKSKGFSTIRKGLMENVRPLVQRAKLRSYIKNLMVNVTKDETTFMHNGKIVPVNGLVQRSAALLEEEGLYQLRLEMRGGSWGWKKVGQTMQRHWIEDELEDVVQNNPNLQDDQSSLPLESVEGEQLNPHNPNLQDNQSSLPLESVEGEQLNPQEAFYPPQQTQPQTRIKTKRRLVPMFDLNGRIYADWESYKVEEPIEEEKSLSAKIAEVFEIINGLNHLFLRMSAAFIIVCCIYTIWKRWHRHPLDPSSTFELINTVDFFVHSTTPVHERPWETTSKIEYARTMARWCKMRVKPLTHLKMEPVIPIPGLITPGPEKTKLLLEKAFNENFWESPKMGGPLGNIKWFIEFYEEMQKRLPQGSQTKVVKRLIRNLKDLQDMKDSYDQCSSFTRLINENADTLDVIWGVYLLMLKKFGRPPVPFP